MFQFIQQRKNFKRSADVFTFADRCAMSSRSIWNRLLSNLSTAMLSIIINRSNHFPLKFQQQKASNLLFVLLSLVATSKSYCEETTKKSLKEKTKMNLLVIVHNLRLMEKQRKRENFPGVWVSPSNLIKRKIVSLMNEKRQKYSRK